MIDGPERRVLTGYHVFEGFRIGKSSLEHRKTGSHKTIGWREKMRLPECMVVVHSESESLSSIDGLDLHGRRRPLGPTQRSAGYCVEHLAVETIQGPRRHPHRRHHHTDGVHLYFYTRRRKISSHRGGNIDWIEHLVIEKNNSRPSQKTQDSMLTAEPYAYMQLSRILTILYGAPKRRGPKSRGNRCLEAWLQKHSTKIYESTSIAHMDSVGR